MHEPLDAHTLRERREAHRRRLARRRRVVALGAAIAVVAVVAVALASGGSGSPAGGHGHAADATRASTAAGAKGAGGKRSGAARPSGRPGNAAVPVLMYHVIAAAPAGAPFPGLYVAPGQFSEQMHALAAAGWHAVTLDQLAANWREGAPLGPGKSIVLSFDNGYHSQYSQALPVLRSLGWVGDENIQLTGLPPSQGGLSSREVRALVDAGWELDTQGLNHADLITLDSSALREQVQGTREVLRKRYHVPVDWFCYPSGHYDAAVIAAVKAAGYTGSTTVVPGWARRGEDAYRMHRLRVLGGTSGRQLVSLIEDTRADPPAPASYSG
ncbi:MAG TPA: polysaccharide deacetylase family protein [Solirubrobacteraceae bacterium]|nr:polysaccharide deacetylase family protein [Solirubrobacteraceae bacterium]